MFKDFPYEPKIIGSSGKTKLKFWKSGLWINGYCNKTDFKMVKVKGKGQPYLRFVARDS